MASFNLEDLLTIHQTVIEETGGSQGLRDPALLKAIIAKPDASFGGEDLYPDLFSKAAAIYEAIVNYYVFIDGNKRTGVAALGLYLEQNHYTLEASNAEIESYTLELATNHPDLAEVAIWVAKHSRPTQPE